MAPLLQSICAATPAPHTTLFIASPGDTAEISAIRRQRGNYIEVTGNYAQKINEGVRATIAPLLFFGADDLHFHPGWFEAAKAAMTHGVGVVGTQDLCNRRTIAGTHATHFLVTRAYTKLGSIDNRFTPLHIEYPHEFVDDEFVATAKYRNAWAFAHNSVVEHLHPDANKAPMDALYAGQRRRMRAGRIIFSRRSRLWM